MTLSGMPRPTAVFAIDWAERHAGLTVAEHAAEKNPRVRGITTEIDDLEDQPPYALERATPGRLAELLPGPDALRPQAAPSESAISGVTRRAAPLAELLIDCVEDRTFESGDCERPADGPLSRSCRTWGAR